MKLLYQSRWLKRQAFYIQPGSSTIASISKFVRTQMLQELKPTCNIKKALNIENIDPYLEINV